MVACLLVGWLDCWLVASLVCWIGCLFVLFEGSGAVFYLFVCVVVCLLFHRMFGWLLLCITFCLCVCQVGWVLVWFVGGLVGLVALFLLFVWFVWTIGCLLVLFACL